MQNSENLNQKELLVRLDERVIQIQRDMDFLKKTAIPTNEHQGLMREMSEHEDRLERLEKFNTKFIAYLGMASTLGGVVASLIISFLRDALSNWIKL
jgi:hypothetical protein